MFNVRCWLLAIAFVLLGHQAQSQATAPAPKAPQSSVPDNTSFKNYQLDAPSPGTVPHVEVAVSTAVQLDTLKQVLAMIIAADQVRKLTDYEDAKFGADDSAKLDHRLKTLNAFIKQMRESCK